MNLKKIKAALEEIIREQDRCIKRNLGLGDDTDDIGDYVDLRTRVIALSSLAQIASFKEDQKVMKERWDKLQKEKEEEHV